MAKTIAGLTLHTPSDPELSAGISCFEVQGVKPNDVDNRLAAKKIRTNASPYKVSYARVAAGVMNFPEDIDAVLREIRAIAPKSAVL
jgi:isopenicillin-N epimerase